MILSWMECVLSCLVLGLLIKTNLIEDLIKTNLIEDRVKKLSEDAHKETDDRRDVSGGKG